MRKEVEMDGSNGGRESGLTTRGSSACESRSEKRGVSLLWNRLRIDAKDGSHAMEYRIEDGRVESRILHALAAARETTDITWQLLTPEQLAAHVLSSTVVAHWLSRRMGVHALMRACHQSSSVTNGAAQGRSCRREELVINEFSPLLAKTPDKG